MRKWIILGLVLTNTALLSGCMVKKDISLKDIDSNIKESISLENMQMGDSKSLKRHFGLNEADFDEVVIYNPSYTMDVDELLLIKVSNEDQIDIVEQSIESRVNSQIETFGSYGPKQCAMLENYELIIAGDYIFYVVSENAEKIVEAFKESIYS